MNIISNATPSLPITQPDRPSLRTWLSRTARRGWHRLLHMAEVIRTRRMLAAMDARMLADIGLSPGDARIEASRWAWDIHPSPRHAGDRDLDP
ncbi:DUF1127 domain-containing protein [Rhodovastum atsumiense]|uniref:DUF1127 domain-containing protein n=2 Tax=Rhodovastum atsumiense TaxID=504468 RepID=A0A5M6IQS0_9PROT|nr:DUF1127 domain-containing protein [Rhodovastum atsumiense]